MSNVRSSVSSNGQRQVSMSTIPSSLRHRRRDLSFQRHPLPGIKHQQSTNSLALMFTISRNQSTASLAAAWRAVIGASSALGGDPREDRMTSGAKYQRSKKKICAAARPGGRTR